MSGQELMAVISFGIVLIGALATVWFRVEGKISEAKKEASGVAAAANALATLTRQELSEHKLHVAETYATKQGMQEQTGQIMRAIESVGHRIDGMNERLDRAFENQNKPRTTRA